MAIGIGRMVGFKFPENFNNPYVSQNITEFWRRWHMTLGGWMRNYLYIPLGGNRRTSRRTYLNLGIVFILCGLWHGAAFTFIFWGAYHGSFLIFERLGMLNIGIMRSHTVRQIYTWLVIIIGWVIFRSNDLYQAGNYIKSLFGLNTNQGLLDFQSEFNFYTAFFILVAFLISTGFGGRLICSVVSHGRLNKLKESQVITNLAAGILYMTCVMFLISNNSNPFIYFRF
jgi:alginate O-acetyltransferase complex protein AlgI